MTCLLQVWGSARARAEAAGSGNERNNTTVASDVTAGVNNGSAQQLATESRPGGTEPVPLDHRGWETSGEPVHSPSETDVQDQEETEDLTGGAEATDALKASTAKALRVFEAPKLGANREYFWSIKDWNRQVCKITNWIGYHSKPMQNAIEAVMNNFADVDPKWL